MADSTEKKRTDATTTTDAAVNPHSGLRGYTDDDGNPTENDAPAFGTIQFPKDSVLIRKAAGKEK